MHNLHIADIYIPSNMEELQGQTQTLSAAIRYLIAADSMCLSSFTFTQPAPEKTIQGIVVYYSHSRSFKVTKIGTNHKSICDFLLVFHCTAHICISYIVSDIQRICELLVKNLHFSLFTPPPVSFETAARNGLLLGHRV